MHTIEFFPYLHDKYINYYNLLEDFDFIELELSFLKKLPMEIRLNYKKTDQIVLEKMDERIQEIINLIFN